MVIDTHIRPALFSPICENKERFEKRCDQMNYHLMKPSSIELLKKQYALAGIEKVFLLPSDCSFETGEPDISNDEIEKIVQCDPTFFVGFASADPRKESAAEELEKAFKFQNLAGLYIQDYICIPVMKDYLCCMIYVRNIKGRSFFRQD